MRPIRRRRGEAIGAATIAALAIAVPMAGAAELSREQYSARVEPICKTNTEANRRIFKGAKAEVKADELKQAAGHFTRAAAALERTISQLKAVPRPAADEARLAKWIGYLETESSLLGGIGRALAQEDKAKAQLYSVRLNRNSNLANNTVLAFAFEYCRIDPARFG
ncbi:MAG TPA: hypothetical protein VEW07_08320 [Solirubrobacterales bacterium]|nr:hypothetical protein [Solirubrobacterales bacterium]